MNARWFEKDSVNVSECRNQVLRQVEVKKGPIKRKRITNGCNMLFQIPQQRLSRYESASKIKNLAVIF